jgi:outer membrane protein insertion porin family
LLLLILAGPAWGQGVEFEGRPIEAVRVEGLQQVPQDLVRNQIRTQAGNPYDPGLVEDDITRITHLGRFAGVRAEVSARDDGAVVVTFIVNEQPLLDEVRIEGNKALDDKELLKKIVLAAGDPRDPFLINQGKQRIIDAYTAKGYFVADVQVDQQALDDKQVLIYRVREGPRVTIRDIRFQGNTVFDDDALDGQIKSDEYFIFLKDGVLSREQLELDAATIRQFYRDRGYLDAKVGRQIDLSPDQEDATVTFMVDEGPQYTVGQVEVEGEAEDLFPAEQVRMHMTMTPGDFYSQKKLKASRQALRNLYGELGYIEANVRIEQLFHDEAPKVDLLVRVETGQPYTVGQVTVRGNSTTKQRVILRQVRGMDPGEPYDHGGVEETRRRLNRSRLFSEANVTILGEKEDAVRDALIEVQEQQTGRLSFGAGVSSDAGLIGAINLSQANFDIADPPESFGELLTGEAFRGGGQQFNLSLQPGSERSRYSVGWREPYLFESDYSLDTSAFFFNRDRDEYDEQRAGGTWAFGQRFGDVWQGSIDFRATDVEIADIDRDAPVDVFDVEGGSLVTATGLTMQRDTTDEGIFPSEGSRIRFGVERVGTLGGDFDFTKLDARIHKFWTIDEDFLGRKTVFSFRGDVGFIPEENEAPVFERYYAGGHSSFRGFQFRGIGPRGIRNDTGGLSDEAIGGRFKLLAGFEYEFPLFDEWVRGVVFTDQGTIAEDPTLSDWRVSVGSGVRVKVPFLGRAPLALDFAWPIQKESTDETRIFSFNLDVPFQ